jgi:hypothetical protein
VCGPSGSMTMAQGQAASLSSLLAANYQQKFGAQSAVVKNLNNLLTPIAEAGPDQQGFGANELAALNTQAQTTVGQNYAKAQAALNNQLAARGGGSADMTSGADAQLKEQLASQAAAQSSNESLAITRANYAQGRQNWQNATAGLKQLGGEYNPAQFGELGIEANNQSFKEATQIQEMNNREQQAISGAIEAGVSALAGGIGNLDFQGTSYLENKWVISLADWVEGSDVTNGDFFTRYFVKRLPVASLLLPTWITGQPLNHIENARTVR